MFRWIAILLLANQVAVSSIATRAQADLIYRVDLDPFTSGIQSSLVAQPGQLITADIVMELSGTTTIDIYGVSLQFDDSELAYRPSESVTIPLPGFEELDTLTQLGTTITGIRAATPITAIGTGPQAPQSFVIARLKFFSVTPAGNAADIDLILLESDLDGSFDNFFQPLTPQFYGASIISVPEPSLCGLSAMMALMLFKRRPRRRTICA